MNNLALATEQTTESSAFSKIAELSGLREFKALVSSLKVRVERDKHIKYGSNLHMTLAGNPGVGKSTVAKLMGQVYFELGLLPANKLLKVTRSDLVAGYVGETTIKTETRVNEAMGGILFIDDAHTLAISEDDMKGQEALYSVFMAMETYKSELAVIFADYPDKIESLLDKNAGFRSKIGHHLLLSDYTNEELKDIFTVNITKAGLDIEDKLISLLEGFMQRYYLDTKRKTWGNARTIVALVDEMKKEALINGESTIGIRHIPSSLRKYLDETAT